MNIEINIKILLDIKMNDMILQVLCEEIKLLMVETLFIDGL